MPCLHRGGACLPPPELLMTHNEHCINLSIFCLCSGKPTRPPWDPCAWSWNAGAKGSKSKNGFGASGGAGYGSNGFSGGGDVGYSGGGPKSGFGARGGVRGCRTF